MLGLVFIFIIAFLINGLPNLRGDRNNNELTANMVSLQNEPPGLAAKERKARTVFNRVEPVKKPPLKVQISPTDKQSLRFETALPGSTSAANRTDKTIEIKRTSAPVLSGPITTPKRVSKTVKSALPKIYIVREGDSLWRIAAEWLGDGSRYSEIAKLNAGILEDEDSLVVGMRLKMPAR
jgi:nucleoid-associated protein YgaU